MAFDYLEVRRRSMTSNVTWQYPMSTTETSHSSMLLNFLKIIMWYGICSSRTIKSKSQIVKKKKKKVIIIKETKRPLIWLYTCLLKISCNGCDQRWASSLVTLGNLRVAATPTVWLIRSYATLELFESMCSVLFFLHISCLHTGPLIQFDILSSV